MIRVTRVLALLFIVGCDDGPVDPPTGSAFLQTLGLGGVSEGYTGEVWVRGNAAYTTTWGFRSEFGNAIKIWDISAGAAPSLGNRVIVPGAGTLGDMQTSEAGSVPLAATRP